MTDRIPDVSVIVPCFNQGKFLRDCLTSVVSQTFVEWECIVIDDGSTDNTRAVATEFTQADARFKYHFQINAGLSGARNSGIALARGTYLNFLDADDLLLPSMLQTLFNRIQRQPYPDLVYSGHVAKSESLKITLRSVLPEINFPAESFYRRLCLGNLFPVHAALVRKKCLESTGLFDVSLKSCEDWDLWLRVGRITNNVLTVGEALVIYRQSESSMTRNVSTFFNMGLIVLDRTVDADPRVSSPLDENKFGYRNNYQEGRRIWCFKCIGLYLAAGDVDLAVSTYRNEIKSTVVYGDFLQIWKHLLFGAILANRRTYAWKIHGKKFLEFAHRVLEHAAPGISLNEIVMRIDYYNAPFIRRLLLRMKRHSSFSMIF